MSLENQPEQALRAYPNTLPTWFRRDPQDNECMDCNSDGYDAIGLLKMVCGVAHDQAEAKQTVMGFVESTAELFT